MAPGENPNYPDGISDNTHFAAEGAIEVARIVARQLKDQRILPPAAVVRLGAPADESRIIWPPERPV